MADMKREDGYYFIKYDGVWVISLFKDGHFIMPDGKRLAEVSKNEIDERRITRD